MVNIAGTITVYHKKEFSKMCGICGIISNEPSERIDPQLVIYMRDTLSHRGPDDKGYYVGPGVALGHRRLSIIDLRPEGRQPMANENNTIQIVFNGEIYNFSEHRNRLISRGHRFRSHTDTEVIIHLYEELGVECLRLLRGMFALAIWDERKQLLFLARDRLGKKPLYYYFDGHRFLFGSEAKAILAYPGISREPDLQALDYYVSFGYVPAPFSVFKGVRKLPPAHYLTFERGRLEVRRYWQVHYLPKLNISEQEACEQILERLTEAVKIRLISDVPLGAFLSGGIDSSTIVALMSKLGSAPVKTFSIGFREPKYNETQYARLLASKFNTDHHEFIVEPDATSVLERLVWHYDEPYADSSALPTYYLSKLTRDYVTVALNGDAGDENFGGYRRYLSTLIAQHLYGLPTPLRSMANSVARIGDKFFLGKGPFASKLHTLAKVIVTEPRRTYAGMLTIFDAPSRHNLYSDSFAHEINGDAAEQMILRIYDASDADHIVDATLNVDLNFYLPYDLLVKVDIASMAVGLEARSPMVDHEFIEFIARLPTRFKISGITLKAIFKKALRNVLPEQILSRRKMGFGVPLDHWFRGQLSDYLHDILLSSRALGRGYFKPGAVEHVIDAHIGGVANHQYQLWTLLMFELWHRIFLDPAGSRARYPHSLAVA